MLCFSFGLFINFGRKSLIFMYFLPLFDVTFTNVVAAVIIIVVVNVSVVFISVSVKC